MGNRRDERSSRRPEPSHPESDPRREGVSRAFDRGEDMGGSGWSGASGRGGMSYGDRPDEGGYPREGGYPSPRERAYPHYSQDPYPREGADNTGGYPREGGFAREAGFGHVPGQRWGGGYGGDVSRGREGASSGRGFPGSDFGPPQRHPEHRYFGNEVDRGSSRGGSGYGSHGTDLGMGARDQIADRGPHYGKGPKGYKRSDARIHDDVCEAIAHQGHIDASDVEVKVTDGIVTLSGTVLHRHDKKGLEHIVEHTRGVDEVHNEIRLKRNERNERNESPPRQGDGNHKNGKTLRS